MAAQFSHTVAAMSFEASLAFARRCDAADPLREFREKFALPRDARGEPLLYFAGHSLGLLPLAARDRVTEELDDWARLAVLGHESARRPWIHYHENLTAGLQHVVGARASEVVAMNSLTVDLHLLMASFYRPSGARKKILIEAGAFSSDRHAVATQIEWRGLDPRSELVELPPRKGEDLVPESAIENLLSKHGHEVALVLWPGVQFRTGQAFDLNRIVRAGHSVGCVVGFDLAHSVGNMPLALHDSDADFAAWCSYKYLNAGPGAIGGCFIHERHFGSAPLARLSGWWGHDVNTRFQMGPEFKAMPGAAGWQVSNPSILSAAPLLASLEMFQAAKIERLREKSIQLTGFFEYLLEPLAQSIQIVTPRNAAARGAQLSLRILGSPGHGRKVFDWLSSQGAICDWRDPDIIRAAPIPLYNTFEDVYRLVELLKQAVQSA
jgi:kynureninase